MLAKWRVCCPNGRNNQGGSGMGNDRRSELSDAQAGELRRVAGIMIPADDTYGVPGADDSLIFADILASLGRDTGDVVEALATLRVAELDAAGAEAVVQRFLAEPTRQAAALGRVVLQCYYRDDRVLLSVGHEARAPFPKGNVLEQGDWSLLEPVKARAPFWRRA